MMLMRLKQLNKRENGLGLVELMIGIAIAGLIGVAVVTTTVLMFKVNAGSTNQVMAIRQVQNAGMWITQDVQTAQTITMGGSHFVELLWADWGGTKYKVDYDYDTVVAGDLIRKYYVKHATDTDYVLNSQTVVAHYIDSSMDTSMTPQKVKTRIENSGGMYILTVTATITGFSANGLPVSEARTYEILPRAGG